jgi:L-ascorbate metabolism protein UlaG (beta-lactamase superfamily)
MEGTGMAKLLYQGHGSFRLTAEDGTVVYVDPYAGEGYDAPADIVLVTHQHFDHNKLELITQKDGCSVITNAEAISGGTYGRFSIKGIEMEAVPACNRNHDRSECVGYVITVDGVKVYAAGDTSATDAMKTFLPGYGLDYALLPTDGIYNMDAGEAAACARRIGAKHNIPIHMKPGALFDRRVAEAFDAPDRLIIEPGWEITL